MKIVWSEKVTSRAGQEAADLVRNLKKNERPSSLFRNRDIDDDIIDWRWCETNRRPRTAESAPFDPVRGSNNFFWFFSFISSGWRDVPFPFHPLRLAFASFTFHALPGYKYIYEEEETTGGGGGDGAFVSVVAVCAEPVSRGPVRSFGRSTTSVRSSNRMPTRLSNCACRLAEDDIAGWWVNKLTELVGWHIWWLTGLFFYFLFGSSYGSLSPTVSLSISL